MIGRAVGDIALPIFPNINGIHITTKVNKVEIFIFGFLNLEKG